MCIRDRTESGHAAAQAIMTTDTHEKEIAVEVMLGGVPVTIGGMCKGSGTVSYTHLDVYKRQVHCKNPAVRSGVQEDEGPRV